MYDIIIVGAGPAGLTAAIYALRANKKTLILEGKSYGGRIINAHKIDNYPGLPNINGFDYANALYKQVKDLGAEIKYEKVLQITEDKKVITGKNTYEAKAVILAIGSENKKLGLPNEDELLGKGISYCATCDGAFFKGKDVAVCGIDDEALTDALYLSNIANKVYLIHQKSEFDKEAKLFDELKNKDNVEILLNSNVISINGKDRLESITISLNNKKEQIIAVSALFIAAGGMPKSSVFANVVDINKNGFIESSDGVHTKTKGIYVAGDARDKLLRQLTTAVSDGSIAAVTAIKEMN